MNDVNSNEGKALKAITDWNKAQITLLEDSASMRESCNPDVLLGKIEVLSSLSNLLVEVTKRSEVVPDREVIAAMRNEGRGFAAALANLFLNSDPDNRVLVKNTWRTHWDMWSNRAIEIREEG